MVQCPRVRITYEIAQRFRFSVVMEDHWRSLATSASDISRERACKMPDVHEGEYKAKVQGSGRLIRPSIGVLY